MSRVPVNKSDIVDAMAEAADISRAAAGRALNGLLESITAALRSGNQVSFIGFGTFAVKARPARVGRNPKTGAPIQIAAAIIPNFKAGKALKDAVNSGAVVVEEIAEEV
jgi:DNA-binding protein HU-beta